MHLKDGESENPTEFTIHLTLLLETQRILDMKPWPPENSLSGIRQHNSYLALKEISPKG